MRIVIRSTIALLGAASLLGAQATAHRGTLRVVDEISTDHALTTAQRAAASVVANKVVAILRRDDALTNPVGYSVTLHLTAQRRQPNDAPGPDVHEVILGSVKYFEDRDGTTELGAAGFDFHIAVNAAGYATEIVEAQSAADQGPPILGEDPANLAVYRETGTMRGRPVYAGDCTYLTHRSVPPIVPVTKERFLSLRTAATKATAARHTAQLSGMSAMPSSDALRAFLRDRPERDAANKKTLEVLKQSGASADQMRQAADAFKQAEAQQEAALRQEASGSSDQAMQRVMDGARAANAEQVSSAQSALDGLPASERKAGARVVGEAGDDFRLARSDDADDVIQPLMQSNAAFYDRTLSADVPQLIWLCAYHLQGLPDTSYDRLAQETASWREEKAWNERRIRDVGRIRDQLDWAALDGLLRP